MAVVNEPTKWNKSLVNSGDVNAIPDDTTVGSGEFSFEEGFPQITQIPLGAGGIAPDRKDFNGVFKLLGAWIYYIQNGGIPSYNANYDYIKGRIVLDNDAIYICIAPNGKSSTVIPPTNTNYWSKILSISDLSGYVTNPVNADLIFNDALRIKRSDNNQFLALIAGATYNENSSIKINGTTLLGEEGQISLRATDGVNTNAFVILPNGDITIGGVTLKNLIASNSLPSNTYLALTLGTSGATYTAPADGFIAVSFSVSQGGVLDIKTYDNSSNILIEERRAFPGSGSSVLASFVPIRKNQTFSITYASVTSTQFFKFIYAVGSES